MPIQRALGNAWATNVNVVASQKGLYEGLESMDTSAAITRDNAAQMVWNALNAYEVEYKTTIITGEDGKLETIVTVQDKVVGTTSDKITLLKDKYNAWVNVGTLTGISSNTITITMSDADKAVSDLEPASGVNTVSFSKLTTDYSNLLGQKVIETTAKVVTLNKRDNEGQLIGVDDNALCILRMSGGALGTMAASWTIYGHECQSTCLYGTKGIMLIYSEPSSPIIVSDMEGNRPSYNLDVPHNGTGVIDEFVDALVHDREPEVSGREALTVMRTIFASINSSNISRTVAVNSDFVTHF